MNLEQINRQEEILTKQPNIDKIKSSIENSLINRELVVGLPENSRTMLSTYESFVTMRMPLNWSYRAPDGSYIWKLPDVRGAGLCKCILPAYHVSTAQRHKTVDEIWYFVSGHSRLWRKRDDDRKGEVVDVESGLSVTIPVGTYFQFKNTGGSDLVVLILTSPIWPGPQEAEYVENYWQLVK